MGKYIHLFETIDELNEKYYGEDYHEPWVSLTLNGEEVSMTVTIDEGPSSTMGFITIKLLNCLHGLTKQRALSIWRKVVAFQLEIPFLILWNLMPITLYQA